MKLLPKVVLLVAIVLALPAGSMAKQDGIAGKTSAPPTRTNTSNDLKKSLEAYRRANLETDVEGVLSFVYPRVFAIVPRQSLKALITKVYSSEGGPKMKGFDYGEIGPVQTYSKGQFISISYTLVIELPRPGDATPQIDAAVIKILKAKMGAQTEVVIDKKRNVVSVKKPSVMLAINENKSGWKVLEKEYLDMFRGSDMLPEDLFAKLK